MTKLESEIVDYILSNCPARTNEALRDRFGISYNTLRKIEEGEPIRSSLAQRLQERFSSEISR